MISRDLVEWFVERALEYQTLLPEDYKHDIRFEIIKRGFIVTIWSKEEDEDGICMYCYDSRPETGNWTGGWICTWRRSVFRRIARNTPPK